MKKIWIAAALAFGLASCAPASQGSPASPNVVKAILLGQNCELLVLSGSLSIPGASVGGVGLKALGCSVEYRLKNADGTYQAPVKLAEKTWAILPAGSTVEARQNEGEWQQVAP